MEAVPLVHSCLVRPATTADVEPSRVASPAPDLETVYRANLPFVWRSLRRLGVEEAWLPDAAHDVFVVVHRQLAGFEGRSSLKTWLFGIALRVARGYRIRASRRAQPVEASAVGSADAVSAELACDTTDRVEAQRLVRRALERLQEDRRIAFVLSDLEDMTANEIAAALDLPLGTVYTRIRLARRDFESALRSFGVCIPRRHP